MRRFLFDWRGRCAAVGLLALTACGGVDSTPQAQPRSTVVAREMSFTPALVNATAGKALTVAFINEGALEHDWAILRLAAHGVRATREGAGGTHQTGTGDGSTPTVHVAALPGQRGEVTFTPDDPGRYTIVCTVPGHKEAGMMGMLTVVE